MQHMGNNDGPPVAASAASVRWQPSDGKPWELHQLNPPLSAEASSDNDNGNGIMRASRSRSNLTAAASFGSDSGHSELHSELISKKQWKGMRHVRPPGGCYSPPYLYVTFHGGSTGDEHNVVRYARDGCNLGTVLMTGPHKLRELRGMMLSDGHLLVAEAYRYDSKIVEYGPCQPESKGQREYVRVLTRRSAHNEGLWHPYGFAQWDGYLYVSNQNSHEVVRYDVETGLPGPVAPVLKEYESKLDPGTFVKFKAKKGRIRGVAFDKYGVLYVANKDLGVLLYNHQGALLGRLPVKKPISVFYCFDRDSVWIGSVKRHSLYEFSAQTHLLIQVISDPSLRHPAGMVSYGDSLYVIGQATNRLLEYSISSGKLRRTLVDKLPDDGERVILSPC
mmetsp:Transcript_29885/g.74265  ORF Transcript_29885/g.74265 Transcript_29885/m.74265 type:complete len:391 (+) Transcript_29885:3-1175(+)